MDLIRGLAFRGFRSFRSNELAILTPLTKVNLLAGQNNSGKSNVLRVLMATFGDPPTVTNWDRPLGDTEWKPATWQLFSEDAVLESAPALQPNLHRDLSALMARISDYIGAEAQEGMIWLPHLPKRAGNQAQNIAIEVAEEVQPLEYAETLSRHLAGAWNGAPRQDTARVIEYLITKRPSDAPQAFLIEGNRAISSENSDSPDLNGRSLKRRLLELQNPSSDRLGDRSKFLAIQEFVRAVLEDGSVTIDIPYDLSTIHVTQAGHTLPIESLGTGVHEVVIIAAAATVVTDSILCIEEPEVHLHPLLQRKLISYLDHSTTNQYFIATHSANMLDTGLGSIFHVRLEGGASQLRYAGNASQRAAICADLGYRPSDLVQSNAILWVEGPSDRTYLKDWLEKRAPGRFKEGIHYSIMFYGGSLLKELSPHDLVEVDEFISLRRLNRYMAVIIDSDRTYAAKKLGSHKLRVIEALKADEQTGVAWVTWGYTIENYLSQERLDAAIRTVHPRASKENLEAFGRWQNPLSVARVGTQPSKTAIARQVILASANDALHPSLAKELDRIIALISRANGLSPEE